MRCGWDEARRLPIGTGLGWGKPTTSKVMRASGFESAEWLSSEIGNEVGGEAGSVGDEV